VEIPLAWRPTEDRRGPARADPADERGKPAVREAIQESEEEVVDLVIVREPIERRRTAFDDENSILPP